jgi:hypothetical protein
VGDGLEVSGIADSITTTGTLKLNADISDLTNVSSDIPLSDEVLTWDSGTSSWKPKTFLGSGTSSLVWDNISNVQSLTGTSHYIMKVNGDADELNFVQNQLVYAPDFISGVGIKHGITYGNNGASLRLDTDLSEIYTTTTNTTETTLVIVDEDSNQRRVKIGNVSLDNFNNPVSDRFLRNSGVSAVEPVSFDNTTTTFSLTDRRFEINFDIAEDYGISGVLPITAGGTSASTSEKARENLGLTYNSDIMKYNDPRFVGEMKGTDILIRPYYLEDTNLTIQNSGSGYVDGTVTVVLTDGSFQASVETGPSGGISVVTASSVSGHQNYLNWNVDLTGTVKQGLEESGKVKVEARTGYLNFGQETGASGYGIGYDGSFWFREKGKSWQNSLPFTLEDADNVESTMTDTDPGTIMIWDGTEFKFQEISGAITMNASGVTSLVTGTIDPLNIIAEYNSGSVNVDRYEFGTLYDINTGSTIQEQLNEKVTVSGNGQGDMIYYNGSSWVELPYDPDTDKVLVSTGLSVPTWDYVSTTYQSSTLYEPGDGILYLDSTSGTSTTLYTNMSNILQKHSGSTGGIVVSNSILSTDISSLPDVSGFNTTDFVISVNNPTLSTPLDEQVGLSTFVSTIAGEGISYSSGELDLKIDNFADTGEAGSSTLGRLVYVLNDGSGNPALAFGDGTNWKKIELGSF